MITYHAGLGGGLHGDLGVGVDAEAGIEDAVTDLIAKLVRVTLSDGLGGEVDVFGVGLVVSASCFCHSVVFSGVD